MNLIFFDTETQAMEALKQFDIRKIGFVFVKENGDDIPSELKLQVEQQFSSQLLNHSQSFNMDELWFRVLNRMEKQAADSILAKVGREAALKYVFKKNMKISIACLFKDRHKNNDRNQSAILYLFENGICFKCYGCKEYMNRNQLYRALVSS